VIVRNDLLPHSYTIPQSHQDFMRRFGKNEFGEPMYRLILAETRVTKADGSWAIWDESIPVEDRGINFRKALEVARRGGSEEEIEAALEPTHPMRVDVGITDVPLYPSEGFCIEKWKPAFSFGPPSDWPASEGPYPQYGDYELLAGPVPHLPSLEDIETAVRSNMRTIENRITSRRERQVMMLNARAIREEQVKRDRLAKIEAYVKDGPASLYNRLSLGSGRVIQELATRAGLKGHFGN
jgi:hypothetical protein